MENEKNGEFQLPFKVEEIIGENIKHKIHKKPLLNAENMVLRGKYKSALEIYTRTISRFSELEIKEKLQANIRELQNFLGLQSPELEQSKKITIEPQKDFNSALKELTEDLTTSLTEGLNKLEKVEDELPEKPAIEEKIEEPKVNPVPIFIPTSTVNLENKDSSSLTLEYPSLSKSETDKALSPELSGVVILPTTPISLEQKASSQKLDLTFETPTSEKQEAKQKDEANLNLGLPTGLSAGEWVQKSPSENLGFTPKTEPKQEELEAKLNLGLPTGLPAGEWVQKPPSENLGFTPKTDLTSLPVLEILNELYHSPDWGPFKNLPIRDRRSGDERRKEKKTVSKERRSGIERRKVDLFKQREEFLKNWSTNFILRQTQASVSTGEAISSEVSSLSESPTFSRSDFGILGELSESMSHIDFVPVNLPNPTDKQQIHEKEKIIDQNTVSKSVESPSLPESTRESTPYSIANEEIIREISREINLVKIDLPDPITMRYEGFEDAPKRNISWEPLPEGGFKEVDTAEPVKLTTEKVLYPTLRDETIHQLFKIDLPEPIDTTLGKQDDLFGTPGRLPTQVEDTTPPDIEIVESDTPPPEETQELEVPQIETPEKEPEPERMIHGILELKPPEVDDAPFLTLTYDFSKIPHSFRLSKNYSIMEYSYYKYKPMLMKAQEFARRKMLKNALNYYRVIKSQNIPPELKKMINRNILDITEFLEEYLMSKGG